MKATFDVTIKIDGRSVEAAFGMKDGAEDMDVNVLQIVLKTITDAQKRIKNQVDKFFGVKAAETEEVTEEENNVKQEGE